MSIKDTSCPACDGSTRVRPGEPKGTCPVCCVQASPTVGEALAMAAERIAGGERPTVPALARARKYRNEPVMIDGHRFGSKKEAARYGELKAMHRAGLIDGLKLHLPFDLEVNGIKICRYVCDFAYFDLAGRMVVEDVKSEPTRKNRAYRIKRKLMKAVLGIEIVEV